MARVREALSRMGAASSAPATPSEPTASDAPDLGEPGSAKRLEASVKYERKRRRAAEDRLANLERPFREEIENLKRVHAEATELLRRSLDGANRALEAERSRGSDLERQAREVDVFRAMLRAFLDASPAGAEAAMEHPPGRASVEAAPVLPAHPVTLQPAQAVTAESAGDRIRRQRQALGHTQKEAGDEIGCSTASVGFWESARTQPSRRWIEPISRYVHRGAHVGTGA